MQGQSGVTLERDYCGAPVLVAYGPLLWPGIALIVKIDLEEIVSAVQVEIADAADKINQQVPAARMSCILAPRCGWVCLGGVGDFSRCSVPNQGGGCMVNWPRWPSVTGDCWSSSFVEVPGRSVAVSLLRHSGPRLHLPPFLVQLPRGQELVMYANLSNSSETTVITKSRTDCGAEPCSYDHHDPFTDKAAHCHEGFGTGQDYRHIDVVAAYRCIPQLNVGLLLKTDIPEIRDDQVRMTTMYADGQNKRHPDTTTEIVVAQRKPGVEPKDVRGSEDFRFLSQFKHRATCQSGSCGGSGLAEPMVRALQGKTGEITGKDYRPKEVLASYHYIPELEIGLVLKVDVDEVMAPAILATIKLIMVSAAAVVILGILLAISTKVIWRKVEIVWCVRKGGSHGPWARMY